jgi:hypothetical protein
VFAALPTTEFRFRPLDILDLRRDQLVSLRLERSSRTSRSDSGTHKESGF